MGNDELLSDPANWPRFSPEDDLSGHLRNPFFVRERPDGRFHDVAGELRSGRARREPWDRHGGRGWRRAARLRRCEPVGAIVLPPKRVVRVGSFLGLHLRLPLQDGPTRSRTGHPGPDTPGRPAIGAEATVIRPTDSDSSLKLTVGTVIPARRSPDIHFGLGQLAPETRINVSLRWRDPEGRVRSKELSLIPGWHTIQLGWDREHAQSWSWRQTSDDTAKPQSGPLRPAARTATVRRRNHASKRSWVTLSSGSSSLGHSPWSRSRLRICWRFLSRSSAHGPRIVLFLSLGMSGNSSTSCYRPTSPRWQSQCSSMRMTG